MDIQLDVPSWVGLDDAIAFTLDNTIYIDPSKLSYSAQGLGTLAHELVHVRQYRDFGGIPPFWAEYGLDYLLNRLEGLDHLDAYREISFEQEAYDIGDEVEKRLEQEFGNDSPCDNECE